MTPLTYDDLSDEEKITLHAARETFGHTKISMTYFFEIYMMGYSAAAFKYSTEIGNILREAADEMDKLAKS